MLPLNRFYKHDASELLLENMNYSTFEILLTKFCFWTIFAKNDTFELLLKTALLLSYSTHVLHMTYFYKNFAFKLICKSEAFERFFKILNIKTTFIKICIWTTFYLWTTQPMCYIITTFTKMLPLKCFYKNYFWLKWNIWTTYKKWYF